MAEKKFERDKFARRLKDLLKEQKKSNALYTQRYVAEKTGISQSRISKLCALNRTKYEIEHDISPASPTLTEVMALAEFFGVSVEDLLFGYTKDMIFHKYSEALEFLMENLDTGLFHIRSCISASERTPNPENFHELVDYEDPMINEYEESGTVIKVTDEVLQYLLAAYRNLKGTLSGSPDILKTAIESLKKKFDYPIIQERDEKKFFKEILRYLTREGIDADERYAEALRLFYDSKSDTMKLRKLKEKISASEPTYPAPKNLPDWINDID